LSTISFKILEFPSFTLSPFDMMSMKMG